MCLHTKQLEGELNPNPKMILRPTTIQVLSTPKPTLTQQTQHKKPKTHPLQLAHNQGMISSYINCKIKNIHNGKSDDLKKLWAEIHLDT
jgi:hypothetical protein